jgi:hypothetical protein
MVDNRYTERKAIYEQKKREIARTAKTPQEYEKRIKALARRLNV